MNKKKVKGDYQKEPTTEELLALTSKGEMIPIRRGVFMWEATLLRTPEEMKALVANSFEFYNRTQTERASVVFEEIVSRNPEFLSAIFQLLPICDPNLLA